MRDVKYLVALRLFVFKEENMNGSIIDILERTPVIAATDRSGWQKACMSDAEVIFHLGADIMTVGSDIEAAKRKGKTVFVHIDLAEGIGKDRAGIQWLGTIGADGIISTRVQLVRAARESGLLAVQRFFILDSKGMHSIAETIENTKPDMIEIMPGVIPKALRLLADRDIPVIAGGLIETKSEITAALGSGAIAVSTGKRELWFDI